MSSGKPAKIYHAELWGLRREKYGWLRDHHVKCTDWQRIRPKTPFYLFLPRDEAALEKYQDFVSVPDIFPVHSVGIVTARDCLTIHWTADEVWNTVRAFSHMAPELARKAYKLGKDARDWSVVMAQKDLLDSGPCRQRVVPVLYRPFDVRYTYYTGRSRGFLCMPRPKVMRHMLAGENLALMSCRQISRQPWTHAMVSTRIADDCMVSNLTRERGYLFPVYTFSDSRKEDLLSWNNLRKRRANLNPGLLHALGKSYGRKPTAKDVLNYVYAILYADSYREKYAQFFRIDFPRIPFTANRLLFTEIAKLGGRLVSLHILKSPELDQPAAKFQGPGDLRVAASKSQGFRYEPTQQRVWINKVNYFAPVPLEVWEYQIGGYQVCEKWLKDRKGRSLTLGDVRTYCHIVTALKRTIEIQEEIDALYPRVEEKILHVAAE